MRAIARTHAPIHHRMSMRMLGSMSKRKLDAM